MHVLLSTSGPLVNRLLDYQHGLSTASCQANHGYGSELMDLVELDSATYLGVTGEGFGGHEDNLFG